MNDTLANTLTTKYPGIAFKVYDTASDLDAIHFSLPTPIPSVRVVIHVRPCYDIRNEGLEEDAAYMSTACVKGFQIPYSDPEEGMVMVDSDETEFTLDGDPLGTIEFHVGAWIQRFQNQIPACLRSNSQP